MSWFGGGKKEDKPVASSEQPSFPPEEGFDNESIAINSGMQPGSMSAGGKGTEAFQKAIEAEQQKIIIQAVMFKLTDMSFDSCVTNPGTALSSSERSCITSVTTKYLQTSEIIGAKLSRSK